MYWYKKTATDSDLNFKTKLQQWAGCCKPKFLIVKGLVQEYEEVRACLVWKAQGQSELHNETLLKKDGEEKEGILFLFHENT